MVKSLIFICVLLISIERMHAQADTCQVLLGPISGEYSGDCENGLANGKGKSVGEDTYTGTFRNGWPDGKGKYIYRNGDIYDGFWKNGKKDGKGKFTIIVDGKKQVLEGYWMEDEYKGILKPDLDYKVISSSGIMDYKIQKVVTANERENDIVFSIKSAFMDFSPTDLMVEKTSGEFFQSGRKFGIRNNFYPVHIEVSYSIQVANTRKLCRFSVDILKPGKYAVMLSND
jgi:hypothetical protein